MKYVSNIRTIKRKPLKVKGDEKKPVARFIKYPCHLKPEISAPTNMIFSLPVKKAIFKSIEAET